MFSDGERKGWLLDEGNIDIDKFLEDLSINHYYYCSCSW